MESFLQMYERLIPLEMDEFYEIEVDFYLKFYYDVPKEKRPDFVVAFMNVSSWFGISLRDGVWTFYEGADPSEVIITLGFLKETKEEELESMFAYGIHDYINPKYAENFDYPEEWIEESEEIDTWIWNNRNWLYEWEKNVLLAYKDQICSL